MKHLTIAMYVFLAVGVVAGVAGYALNDRTNDQPAPTACTMEAKQCPDGSFVGREGPDCEFAACPSLPEVPADVQSAIDAKADLITLEQPVPNATVTSPLRLSGEARGTWFFEGDFPLVLTDWDGRIIAESFATAEGGWMTESFVPFSGTIEFDSPYEAGDPDYMRNGTLILQKANPSGLPENTDALEIPVRFTDPAE